MPTPTLFTRFSLSVHRLPRRSIWYLLGGVSIIAFTPALLDRTVPALGPLPGRMLFAFMFVYFAFAMPLMLFRPKTVQLDATVMSRASLWIRAIVCDLWIAVCCYAIAIGQHRS